MNQDLDQGIEVLRELPGSLEGLGLLNELPKAPCITCD
jgi:hypothetical protein